MQDSHGIMVMAKTVKRNGVLTNVINSYLEQHDITQETSIANENVENEQYLRISVKNIVEGSELLKKEKYDKKVERDRATTYC
ncbi:MAG: hypothetical protein ACR5KV_06800 [Wolbachia sp.]